MSDLPAPETFDHIVFDAEPLVAYFQDEPGADNAESFLTAVENSRVNGHCSPTTVTETYVCHHASDEETALDYVETLEQNGITPTYTDFLEKGAGFLKIHNTMALGDAFTLATGSEIADDIGGSVGIMVGADDDFDPFVGEDVWENVTVFRFRTDPA